MRIIINGNDEGGPPNGIAIDLPAQTGDLNRFAPWFSQFQSASVQQIQTTLRKSFASSDELVDSFVTRVCTEFEIGGFYCLDLPDAPVDDLPQWLALNCRMGTILIRESDSWKPHRDLMSLSPSLCELLQTFGRLQFSRDHFADQSLLPDQGFYRPPDVLSKESVAYKRHNDPHLLGAAFFYRTPCNNHFGVTRDGQIIKWTYEDDSTEIAFETLNQFLDELLNFWHQTSVPRANFFYY